MKRRARKLAGIAMGAGVIMMAATTAVVAADETGKDGFLEKVERWQDSMSDKFRDTWRKLRSDSGGKPSVGSASIDLREQDKSYTIRLDLPGRDVDQVEVSLKGESLHILAPENGSLGRYEQTILLAGAQSGAEPKVERRKDDAVITVTVPKGPQGLPPLRLDEVPEVPLVAPSKWESDVLRRMDDLQREMDQIFDDAFGKIPRSPEVLRHFDQPRFGSFIDVKDEGANFVVTAYLPARDMKNVNATIEGRTLKVEALAEDSPSSPDAASATVRRAYYSQELTLPGAVNANAMTLERKEDLLKITIPKAD
jgi:HSP20 family molecular chaperone IbpA